ncbi:MAG: DUF4105 domain-containing protein [Myxococcales bacterium]|nr:DUF4105 domain-containing protein [Myxococcales bacterium]
MMVQAWMLAVAASSGVASDAEPGYLEELISRPRVDLSEERAWHVLGHYVGRPQPRSTVDSKDFFFSREGKVDPSGELEATLRAFFAPTSTVTRTVDPATGEGFVPIQKQHPQCRFPARFRHLAKRLDFDPSRLPFRDCPDLVWWLRQLRVQSVSLVFAGPFLGNPASMFGHTFIRLNQGDITGRELSAYTVNFGANATTNFAVSYALLGIFGGFAGEFSTLPFYLKAKEYTDLEHRELWIYDLSFSTTELENLILHLWEMGQAWFRYYYFDENCSYQLLSVLEAANPDRFHFTDRFDAWVVPSDTMRIVLNEQGLLGEVTYRPAQREVAENHARRLEGSDRELAKALATPQRPPWEALEGLSPEVQAKILDAAYEAHRYHSGLDLTPEESAHELKLLRRRRSITADVEALEIVPPTRPDAAHPTASVSLGGGIERQGAFVEVQVRPALHDLLSDPTGYEPGAAIELLNTTLRLRPSDQDLPQLDRLDFVRIASLSPGDALGQRISWHLNAGLLRRRIGRCEGSDCLMGQLFGGPGLSLSAFGGTLFGFLDVELAVAGPFRENARFAAGSTVGWVGALIGPRLRLLIEGTYLYPIVGDGRPDPLPGPVDGPDAFVQAGLSSRISHAVELRAFGSVGNGAWETSSVVRMYF